MSTINFLRLTPLTYKQRAYYLDNRPHISEKMSSKKRVHIIKMYTLTYFILT